MRGYKRSLPEQKPGFSRFTYKVYTNKIIKNHEINENKKLKSIFHKNKLYKISSIVSIIKIYKNYFFTFLTKIKLNEKNKYV